MKYPYFRGLEADRYSFYRVPKALIKVDLFEKMSGDAKLLYAVLLDRMNLSLKNGWQDENGNAYIICTINEIMDSIRCARQKAVKLLDELEHEYQLIERRRQGLGKPNLLYVKDLYAGLSQSNYWKYENQTSGGLKSELPGVWKSNGSKTDINNTDSSETDLIYSAQSGENISGEMREDERYTETKKAELFAKVRSGQVRILLGSTPKLGAGTNIQDRLIALHHLDCPWKPSDLEQQEGRILRQGNRNQKVKIFRYVTENTFDSYMWQILENKQKFISQIMTSKSPVRACDDVDDTALTYAEIKALATGNPYIKEKMDLDIQVSKLKLMRANHTSQIYSLESDIARRYPAEITAAKERIAGLKADLAVAKPLLEQDKEKFSITVEDRVYTDRKEAGSAILAACAAMKIAKTEGQIADLGGFAISSRFDAFAQTFKLTIKRQSSYTIELGSDPAGNIQRILNALASIEKTLPQVERRLETLQQQLAEAKEEVQRPFPQEAELNEKSARLAELNALLDMDEKGDDAALGMDEEVTDSELPAPKREIERSADSVKRPSILAQLHEKQAERMAEPKPQKKKSHDMEL